MSNKEENIAKEFSRNIIPVTWKGICNAASQITGENLYDCSSQEMLERDMNTSDGIGETYTKVYCSGMNNPMRDPKNNCLTALKNAINKFDDGEEINWKGLKELCKEVCANSRCDCIIYLDHAKKVANDPDYRIVEEYYVQNKRNTGITEKQQKMINDLVNKGAPKFDGKTREQASAYIKKYISRLQNKNITPKQWQYIHNLEKYLDVPSFEGKTRKDASNYIDKYKDALQDFMTSNN